MWRTGYVVYSLFWAIPALLFPFTFGSNDLVNYLFMDAIENFCIILPFTFYWALYLGLIITSEF